MTIISKNIYLKALHFKSYCGSWWLYAGKVSQVSLGLSTPPKCRKMSSSNSFCFWLIIEFINIYQKNVDGCC